MLSPSSTAPTRSLSFNSLFSGGGAHLARELGIENMDRSEEIGRTEGELAATLNWANWATVKKSPAVAKLSLKMVQDGLKRSKSKKREILAISRLAK